MFQSLILLVIYVIVGAGVAYAGQGKSPQKASSKDDYVVASSTKINFEDTLIEGKMQAPNGFFLKGRTPQSLSQMVHLRSNFRSELRNSKSGVSALSK